MPLTSKALLDYMALPEEEQAKLDASPEIGPQLQSFKALPREEQVKVLDGLGASQPRSLLRQAIGMIPMWERDDMAMQGLSNAKGADVGNQAPTVESETLQHGPISQLLNVLPRLAYDTMIAPLVSAGQVLREGRTPEQAQAWEKMTPEQRAVVKESGQGMASPFALSPETFGPQLGAIQNLAIMGALGEQGGVGAVPMGAGRGFLRPKTQPVPVAATVPVTTPTLPPELQDVVNGDAAAFLKPPVNEGTVPTAGEQMLQGMDLKKVAGQTGMGYFKGKDGTEVIFNPDLTKTSALKVLDKQGKLPDIVNGPGTSPKPAVPTDAAVVRSPDGTEIRTVLTDTPEKTAAAIQAQPSTAQVEVKPAAEAVPQVIQDRMQAIRTKSDLEAFSQAVDELAAQEKTPAVTGGTPAVKQPWEMTKAEYVDGHITSPAMHKYGVQKALAEGKPVPPEVLAEYPDLAKQVKPPTATQPTLLQTQATMPPEGLQPKAPQVEHGDLLEGFKPPEAPAPELPFQGEGEMHAGLPIPQKVKDALKRLLPGGQGGWWNGLQEALATQAEKLPSELRVIKEAPNSAAISSVEGARATVANGATNLTKMPWAQAIRKYTPDQFKQLENQAVQIWEQGGKTGASLNQAIDAMPPEIQAMLRYRQSRLPIEQAARKVLGLPEIPKTPGPYFPRLTEQGLQDIKAMARGRANLASDLQTTVRSFQQARSFPTMSQGEAAGMKYQDPRTAWAMREWHSLQLESTAQLMTNLEQKGVLFRTADAAKQASPVGKAFGIEGLPGSTQWFATTKAEREFVMQNLTSADRGALGGLIGLGNQLFRNPNLFNPAPHFTKNMLYKYVMSGGNPGAVASRMAEYERGTSPLVQRFKAVFPESETALSPGVTLDPFLRPDSLIAKGERAIGSINRLSSAAIFEHLDPALRYARWKQYVQSGMSDQTAANHVQVDLIRYGTRSDAVDFWKSIPLNFFVPWRTGTVTSLVKQVISHPIRAAAFIGAVDYLREARYRQSGQWTHLPIDYIESPVAQAIQHHDPKTLAALAATTALFGPGGASTASTLRDAIDDIRGGDEKGRIINMFWGLSQLYNIPKEFQRFQQTGDANHLFNILTSAAVAEHSALNYAPRRLGAYLPEGLPFMQKSNTVNLAEAIQAQRRARSEAIQKQRALRPRPSIEELLTVSP